MGLSKIKIGIFVEQYNEACGIAKLTLDDVSGINRDKEFFEPSKQVGADTSKYKVVPPDYFACNLMHVGRDVVLPIALNHSGKKKYVSPAYTVFKINDESVILREYFFLLLNSKERDRYFWFHTDSSVRDGMEWSTFCDLEIEVPDISVQRKYVDIYLGGQENLNALQKGVEELQRTYLSCMDNIKKSAPLLRLGDHITQLFEKNDNEKLGIDRVRGVSNTKEIQRTKANVSMRDLSTFLVIRRNQFVFNRRTTRNGERLGLGFNDTDEPLLFTNDYVAFEIRDTDVLLPEYLYLYFKRDEFDRYVRYNSWGSATEFFNWEDMQEVRVPVPDISTQKALADIYWIHKKRRELAERLEKQQKDVCPILVRGAIEEGGR